MVWGRRFEFNALHRYSVSPQILYDELGMPAYYGGIIFLVAKFLPRLPICSPDFYSIRGKILGQRKVQAVYFIRSGSGGVNCNLQFIATTFSLPVKTTIATALL